jgi:hypothetical protein
MASCKEDIPDGKIFLHGWSLTDGNGQIKAKTTNVTYASKRGRLLYTPTTYD